MSSHWQKLYSFKSYVMEQHSPRSSLSCSDTGLTKFKRVLKIHLFQLIETVRDK